MSGPGRGALTAGRLRLRAVLERRVDTDDGAGGVLTSWVAESAFWVEVETSSMAETEVALGVRDRIAVRVHFRARTDIAASKRLRVDDRIYDIVSVAPADKRGGWMTVTCEERP